MSRARGAMWAVAHAIGAPMSRAAGKTAGKIVGWCEAQGLHKGRSHAADLPTAWTSRGRTHGLRPADAWTKQVGRARQPMPRARFSCVVSTFCFCWRPMRLFEITCGVSFACVSVSGLRLERRQEPPVVTAVCTLQSINLVKVALLCYTGTNGQLCSLEEKSLGQRPSWLTPPISPQVA